MKIVNFLLLSLFYLASLTSLDAMEKEKPKDQPQQIRINAQQVKKITYKWGEYYEPPCPLSAVTLFGTSFIIKVKTDDGSTQHVPYDWSKEQERWDNIKAQQIVKAERLLQELLECENLNEKEHQLNVLSLEEKKCLLRCTEKQQHYLSEKNFEKQEKLERIQLFVEQHLNL